MKYRFATKNDEHSINLFLENLCSEGKLSIQIKRDQSFFTSLEILGNQQHVLLLEDEKKDIIAGIAIFSERDCYINGKKKKIGYLSDLRIAPAYRNMGHLSRGYQRIKELMEQRELPYAISTIMSDNTVSRKILESGRARLPQYHHLDQCHVFCISEKKNNWHQNPQFKVRKACSNDSALLIEFINSQGKKKNFFPVITEDDIKKPNGLLRGLNIDDFYLAFENDSIVGIVSLWDQTNFRRWNVKDYSRSIAVFRKFYNIYAKLMKTTSFPKANQKINYRFLSTMLAKDDNPMVLESLLNNIWNNLTKRPEINFIMASCLKNDPLFEVFNKARSYRFTSELYLVRWGEIDSILDNKPMYLEIATL